MSDQSIGVGLSSVDDEHEVQTYCLSKERIHDVSRVSPQWGGKVLKAGKESVKTAKVLQTMIGEFYEKKLLVDEIDDRGMFGIHFFN